MTPEYKRKTHVRVYLCVWVGFVCMMWGVTCAVCVFGQLCVVHSLCVLHVCAGMLRAFSVCVVCLVCLCCVLCCVAGVVCIVCVRTLWR